MTPNLRKLVYATLPSSALERLHGLRRLLRRWRYHARQVAGGRRVTAEEVSGALARLGVRHGDVLMVHSSLSRLGAVEGGAEALLQTLLRAVGPSGTLAMPVYPTIGNMVEHLAAHPVFDVVSDPSRMGKLTECLRLHPAARRSLHPSHSVAAVGPRADGLVGEHHRCRSPFGSGSPFQNLIELDAKILCLGVEIAYISSLHVPEERMHPFPIPVYLDGPRAAPVRDERGVQTTVTLLVHDPAVAATRIEKNPALLATLRAKLLERGVLREEPLGSGVASLAGARGLETALEDLAATGLTIYSKI